MIPSCHQNRRGDGGNGNSALFLRPNSGQMLVSWKLPSIFIELTPQAAFGILLSLKYATPLAAAESLFCSATSFYENENIEHNITGGCARQKHPRHHHAAGNYFEPD
jgi:hypothetical protein